MRVIKNTVDYYCDRCNEKIEIKSKIGILNDEHFIKEFLVFIIFNIEPPERKYYDLCSKCTESLKTWIEND